MYNKKRDIIEKRAVAIGEYAIKNKSTLRQLAVEFGVSKSTVDKDLNFRLVHINPKLYWDVRNILEQNKKERSIRGGLALKNKRNNKTID